MSLDYDPEVPAGYQEADLLQAHYEEEGRRIAALNRRGVCNHGWMLGRGNVNRSRGDIENDRQRGKFPLRLTDPSIRCQNDIPVGKVLCLDCGVLVDDR